jgi:hypothetical protein
MGAVDALPASVRRLLAACVTVLDRVLLAHATVMLRELLARDAVLVRVTIVHAFAIPMRG